MIENSQVYGLPLLEFVGGQTNKLNFWLYKENELTGIAEPFNASDCTVNFSLFSYTDNYTKAAIEYGEPILSHACTIAVGDNGIENMAKTELSPNDTASLFGQYIYQLIVVDKSGDTDIPKQGLMRITKNINPSYIRTLL